ncbi:MAG: DNA mismatch repair endonuclease MutL [Desulfobulbales bacterium]
MSKIRILSEHLANQIAAGEVVERPASVVKELVENSLDAGADKIAVQVEGSGTRLIRVVDNGEGMDADDVLLSLERHATSKLSEEKTLDGITTLGFRGEALPSIGSVSRLTILSRPVNRTAGTRAEIRYGTLQAVHEAGCAPGTIVEIRHLFGNVPARKKFLKSGRTELYHVEEVIRNQSLAHAGTAFSLQTESRTLIDLPARDELEARVRDLYRGQDIWLSLGTPFEREDNFAVKGFILKPHTGGASRANHFRILVNGRPVQDRMIRHAVMEGLQGFLMKGRSPEGVLLLTIPPELVDVNVHPAKLEIRFRHSPEVHRFIIQTIVAALRRNQDQVRSEIFAMPSPQENKEELSLPFETAGTTPSNDTVPSTDSQPVQESFSMYQGRQTAEPAAGFQNASGRGYPAEEDRPSEKVETDFSGLNLIGQLFDLYLLCERDGQLLVIDQHAAHERIIYQQLRTGYLQRKVPRQNLMFPLPLELNSSLREAIDDHSRELDILGFSIEHFGDETWLIKSMPALMGNIDPGELIVEILEQLVKGSGRAETGTIPAQIDHLLSSMACKAAVKAGRRLAPREILGLLAQMQKAEFFSHCPHGRPVYRSFTLGEIARWFNRS